MSREEVRESRERGAERMTLNESTRLRPNDWSSLEVRVIDLSETGFRAACKARLQRGGSISLDIAGIGPVEAQVEWQRGDLFGARFYLPIDLDRCAWSPVERESVLARLLVDRAAARRAGRSDVERKLRKQILHTLPMRKGAARA